MIHLASSYEEYLEELPRVGRRINDSEVYLGVFLPIRDDEEAQALGETYKNRNEPELPLSGHDLPEIVRLAAVAAINTSSERTLASSARLYKDAKVFGGSYQTTGIHTDVQFENGEAKTGALGTWYLLTGTARLLLRSIDGVTADEITDELEELSMPNPDPKTIYGWDVIRPECRKDFEQIEITGPAIGCFAVGMSQDRQILPVFHQIETIGSEPRYSTNIHKALFEMPNFR